MRDSDAVLTPAERSAWEHRWDEAEKRLGAPSLQALMRLCRYYGTELFSWLASLYDAETGCFYYSISARDTEGFLPDSESTAQTLSMLSFVGMLAHVDGSYLRAFSQETAERCRGYISSLQDSGDGYFYHPQWGKRIGSSRKGRDLAQCLELIRKFGGTPPYPTALERLERLSEDRNSSVMPPHLVSREAMLAYLDRLDVTHDSHSAGHIISSQSAQIRSAGLAELVLSYFDSCQNSETGLWEEGASYRSLSGVVKIGSFYGSCGVPIRHGDRAFESAISVILSDEDPTYINYVYNPWGALGTIMRSIRSESRVGKGHGEDAALARLLEAFPAMIDKTIEKLDKFRWGDGGFSYLQSGSAPTTQGVPVSLGLPEGDVNGTACALHYTLNAIFSALDIQTVPLCHRGHFEEFLEKMSTVSGKKV